ncbi:MAG: FtsX-like permease family protein [Chloroflexota bacterium]|nr:FtsX-like permease family protein [Chloroflexota bacterium]
MLLKNLWQRKTRTFLTVIGIAIGVAAVVAMGAIAGNLIESYGSVLSNPNADITVSQKDAIDVSFSALDENLDEQLRAVPDVEVVDPAVVIWVQSETTPFLMVFGYEPNSLAVRHYRIIEGKPVSASRQMALGKQAAEDLNKGVGDTLRIYGTPYQVVGIYETGQGLEEGGAVVTLEDAQDIASKPRKVNAYQIKLRRAENIDVALERLRTRFSDLSFSKGSGNETAEEWTGMVEGMAWGIAAIAVIIGGLGMMNTMVMSVFERTREVGVLRALGWGRGRVMGMILGEALLLSFFGGVLGILMGMAMVAAAGSAPGYGSFFGGHLLTPKLAFQGMATALLLGTVGGIYPAWWASKLTPIEALRYEGGASAGRKPKEDGEEKKARLRMPPVLRDLGRRKTRTVLTVLGIGVGVAALVALNGLSAGMISQLNNLAGGSATGDLMLMQKDVPDMSLSAIDERVVRAISNMPEVESVSGMMLSVTTLPGLPFFVVTGLDPNSPGMRHYDIVEGAPIRRPNEVIMGRGAADTLKKEVGDTIQVSNNVYRITGIFETGVLWEEAGVIMGMREVQLIFNRPRQVSYVLVDVHDASQVDYVQEAIQHRFDDVSVSLSSEFAQNTNDMQSMEAMTDVVVLFALLIGGVVILNTMMMTVYERTREIGTLRALGWRKRRIIGMVVQEAILLSALAGVVGIGLGMLLTKSAGLTPLGAQLQGEYSLGLFVETMLIAVFLGVLGGVYPAWRASRLSPVEALRYE